MAGILGTTNNPHIFGASFVVTDSTALAALDASGMTPGTGVYNLATGTVWVLTIAASGGVAVSGIAGMQWINTAIPGGGVTLAALAATTIPSGASLVGVNNPVGRYSNADLQHILDIDMVAKNDLAASDGTGGTSLVATQNTGAYYSNTHALETFLQAVGAQNVTQDTNILNRTFTGVQDKLKAKAAAVLGANFAWQYDEFAGVAIGDQWTATAGMTISTVAPTAITCAGATGNGISRAQVINLRTGKWFFGGVASFAGTLVTGNLKGFGLEAGPFTFTNGVILGLGFVASATKFSVTALVGGTATTAASTINFDNNTHVFYCWGDSTQVKFSVDFETEILLTNVMTNLPNTGTMFQECASQLSSASNAIQYGATCFGHALV